MSTALPSTTILLVSFVIALTAGHSLTTQSADDSQQTLEETPAAIAAIRYTTSGFMELCITECFTHDRLGCSIMSCHCKDYRFDVQTQNDIQDRYENNVNTAMGQERKHKYSSFLKKCLSWCEKADKEKCVDKLCWCVRKKTN